MRRLDDTSLADAAAEHALGLAHLYAEQIVHIVCCARESTIVALSRVVHAHAFVTEHVSARHQHPIHCVRVADVAYSVQTTCVYCCIIAVQCILVHSLAPGQLTVASADSSGVELRGGVVTSATIGGMASISSTDFNDNMSTTHESSIAPDCPLHRPPARHRLERRSPAVAA